jgi:hypothetical protein
MAARTQPIFAGPPETTLQTFSSATVATKTIFTADATNGSVIEGINAYFSAAVTPDIVIQIVEGATTVKIGKYATAVGADGPVNLFTSTIIPMLDADFPRLFLKPGQTLQIVNGSYAATLDVATVGASYT